jgi:hypothetical protein
MPCVVAEFSVSQSRHPTKSDKCDAHLLYLAHLQQTPGTDQTSPQQPTAKVQQSSPKRKGYHPFVAKSAKIRQIVAKSAKSWQKPLNRCGSLQNPKIIVAFRCVSLQNPLNRCRIRQIVALSLQIVAESVKNRCTFVADRCRIRQMAVAKSAKSLQNPPNGRCKIRQIVAKSADLGNFVELLRNRIR